MHSSEMASSQLLHGRQRAESLSNHAPDVPAVSPVHSVPSPLEAAVLRGRALTSTSGRASPHPRTPAGVGPKLATAAPDVSRPPIERKPSGSYGHHRQASIVHGNFQHSRNTSFANSSTTTLVTTTTASTVNTSSPITPQVIAEVADVDQHDVDAVMMAENDSGGGFVAVNNSSGTSSKGHSRSSSATLAAAAADASQITGQRHPLERMQSASGGKARKDQSHTRSQSRHVHHQQESRTVGEYALHHLFTSFIAQADQKINQCLNDARSPEPRTESICGPGVDPALDQLISALGHIARQKPKPLIDTIMLWRKGKGEEASLARQELKQSRAMTSSTSLPGTAAMEVTIVQQQARIQAERRSMVSIYLLCRVLMEVFSQSTLADVTPDMADKLEDIIYKQLTATDPEYLEESPFRQSNWVIFGQLLGVMGDLDFDRVSDRYLSDLTKMQLHLGPRKDIEGRACLVIRGMRWLRIKYQPETAWDRSCDFVLSIAKLAATASGQSVKYAYNSLLEDLLLPIAGGATSELNTPKWATVTEILKPKLMNMLAKPKHWQSAFPALTVVLCASPNEIFSSQWLSLALPSQPKLKERSTRPETLRCICRLVWTYLFRCTDPPNVTTKNLHEIIRLIFIPGKKSYVSTDPEIAEPLIQLIRIIGYKYRDLCFRNIIFPLMNSELFSSGKDVKIVDLEPEKMVIGIRAFLAIMSDLEKVEHPQFPISFETHPAVEPFKSLLIPTGSRHPGIIASKTTLSKEERLSKPVMVSGFDDVTTEAYIRFCKILGEITLFCDNTFGGQAVLDEKFSQTPKTPIAEAFSFARREDHQAPQDVRQGFYDLLHVAVQALPRCLSPHISFKSLVNLLCTGTAHVKSNIAASSVQSLKSIARQSHAQQVTIGFARFIFNFDNRYATLSDGGMLGPEHIESTLKLYVELLQIWIEEIRQRTKRAAADPADDISAGSRGVQLDLSGLWAHVDEVESHGLFFLCSPSHRVRAFAVTVLRLVTEFDTALGKDSTRIIRIMEGNAQLVIKIDDEKLTVAERSRLEKSLKRNSGESPLVELCSSDVPYDSTIWFKIFPRLVRLSFEHCPFAVTLTRDIVCARISHMHRAVTALGEGNRHAPNSSMVDLSAPKGGSKRGNSTPDMIIEQWRLYLVFACTTLTNTGAQQSQAPQPASQHTRKSSKSTQAHTERIFTAGTLFLRIIPLLAVSSSAVRDAVVTGLGSINKNLYRTLLEALQPAVYNCNDESKARHQRTGSGLRRTRRTDNLRAQIAHIYKLTSHFLQSPEVHNDDWILKNLVNYTQELRLFLNDAEIQNEWEFHKLRTYYCGIMEELYEGIKKSKDPSHWMSFQARKAAFTLMEDWCGYSPNQSQLRHREDSMRRSMLDREQDLGNKGIVSAAMEIEKRDLRTAALSAMATLCGGPVSITTDSKVNLQFDVLRMLSWIDAIFDTPSDRSHAIGRRALTNLIVHNKEHTYFLGRSIEMCYLAKTPKALESYFEVVIQVLTEKEDFAPPFWKILGAGLYTLGNENNQLRMKSARLMRMLEERQQKSSKLQDLDISISDKTIAVYKRAQFEMSQRLAQQHSELAFHVFSEFSRFFKELQPDHQRNMVAAMLPWIQTIELQLDPNGGPTATSYMLLVNMFEITVRFGNALHNEIQALWQALATGPHGGNVQLVLDFMITMCLDRKEQSFVDYARQIIVYLAGTPAGSKVVEFLLLQITPKAMVLEKEKPPTFIVPQEANSLPYLADLGLIFPGGPSATKQQGFSLGQLCLILLVDLTVAPTQIAKENVPLLLQVVIVLWDHYIPLVQDQAREMLVHLIHELVISKMEDSNTAPSKLSIEGFIDSIRRHDSKVVWAYEDFNGKKEDDNDLRVPEAMIHVTTEVVKIFSIQYPGIREEWSKTALKWASNCPVHHLACRSFQLFRSILMELDQPMLADMLARLSNTVADEGTEVQTFSMEILSTLKTIIDALAPSDLIQYPQLFWTTCACLDTIHEREFMESLSMLDRLTDKLDISDPTIVNHLLENKPPKWEGSFEGIQPLVYKGVRSSICLDKSLRILEKLVVLPPNELIGDSSGLVFTTLANLPRFLRYFEHPDKDPGTIASAKILTEVAEKRGYDDIAAALTAFTGQRYRSDTEFLAQTIVAIRVSYFPQLEFKCLVFLMSLLTNKLAWFKIKTIQLLCMIIPQIDMRSSEIAGKGPDLISPLLRLLQTEFCPQALAVLDNVMTMNATPLDNKHLRMSMAGANTSRAIRKEYERTQSLYGIPEESGWSIPVPAAHSATTRNNVHAVFYTCASPGIVVEVEEATPRIELVNEEYNSSYFHDYRTATMMSDETRGDGHMGDLVMKLESLDDFFEDDGPESSTNLTPGSSLGKFSGSTVDVRENLYEQQTFPILHKSLTRNASVSSLQTGFADLRVSPSREAMIMNPTAFAADVAVQPKKQGLYQGKHARSATSPSANQTSRMDSSHMLVEDALVDDGAFSDDDDGSGGRPSGGEKPSSTSIDNTIRPSQGIRSGLRSGIRRLTGGSDAKEGARTREMIRRDLQKSPKVPKVPDFYLQNPKSSDL